MKEEYLKLLDESEENKKNFECPKCGYRFTFKNEKYGKFLGCTNYPKCTYIRN